MATRGRKTASVEYIKSEANLLLSLTDAEGTEGQVNRQFRKGVIAMITRVLFDTDNYKGFQYLDSEFKTVDLPGGTRRELREDYDSTRVRFY